jgi:hypothetical protein
MEAAWIEPAESRLRLVADPDRCCSADVDECDNVKHIDRIELTAKRGCDSTAKSVRKHRQRRETEPNRLMLRGA